MPERALTHSNARQPSPAAGSNDAMTLTRPLGTLTRLTLTAALGLVACSSNGSDSSPRSPDAANTVLEGEVTDAQLGTFLQREPREWAWAGGQFDAPADGATLPPSATQTFAWHADPADFAEGGAAGEAVMTHLLSFHSASHPSLLQLFTTLPDYTPDALHWQKLVAAGEPITVELTTGTFVGADLPADGGPFIGQALTFTIE